MTAQVSVDVVAPDLLAPAPTVPRPRASDEPAPADASRPALADAVAAVDRTPKGRVSTVAVMLDVAVVLALTAAAVLLDRLPATIAAAGATGWLLISATRGHHRRRGVGETRGQRVALVVASGTQACVLVLAVSPWLETLDTVALAELVAAYAVGGVVAAVVARGARPRLVLVGRPRDVRAALDELETVADHEVVAACLTRAPKTALGGLPVYVGLDASAEAADRHAADAVVLLPGARLEPPDVRRLQWALAAVGSELCVGTSLVDVVTTRTRVLSTGGLTLVRASHPHLRGSHRWVKAAVEPVLAAVGLLLLSPLLLVLGLLVRLDSPGPALYRQQRVGRDGRPFTMYKLRSMSSTADVDRVAVLALNEADGVLFKIRLDPRVTRLGGWLRRTSLDELPQLWNVVRGDMSLVGPRPALPDEVARYDVDPRRRLLVKPGITGLWQVSGRSDLTWEQSVRLDVRYVENWSLRLDLAILVRTVKAVLGGHGAY